MKVKLKGSNVGLPNCCIECGCSFEDWQKLQEGKEAELKSLPESIEHLFDAPKSQKKGAK